MKAQRGGDLHNSWHANWPLYGEGKERQKKGAKCSKLVGSGFNKQGDLHMRLVLGNHKASTFLHPLPES